MGRAEFREGGYEDHQAWVDLDLGHEPASEEDVKPRLAQKPTRPGLRQDAPRAEKGHAIDKERQKLQRRLEKAVAEAEARVSELEGLVARLNEELAGADPGDWKGFQDRSEALKKTEEDLMYAMSDWEACQEALERA